MFRGGSLEFDVGAESRRDHWAAVAVVARIGNMLQARRQVNTAPHVDGVIGLEDVLAAVVEMAVAEQKAQAPGGEIILVIPLDGIAHKGGPGAILFAVPPRAIRPHAFGKGLIDFRIREGLGLAVIPPEAGERREIGREILLEIDAEAILAG